MLAVGGARAAEHLRLLAGELQMTDVRQQVTLSLVSEFENFSAFKPGDYNRAALDTLLDQVIAWSAALAPLRQPAATVAARPPVLRCGPGYQMRTRAAGSSHRSSVAPTSNAL